VTLSEIKNQGMSLECHVRMLKHVVRGIISSPATFHMSHVVSCEYQEVSTINHIPNRQGYHIFVPRK
jgi:hypothetical protein